MNNIANEIYGRLFDLLEEDATWADMVPPGNRIRFDKSPDDGGSLRDKPNLADGDMDMARMRLRSGGTSLRTDAPTFATHSAEGDPDYIEKMSFIYRLRLTSRELREDEDSLLAMTSAEAIRAGGARLGLQYVTGVRLRWTTEERASSGQEEGDDARYRLVTDMDILVDVEYDSTLS